jgi:hypothetical protein
LERRAIAAARPKVLSYARDTSHASKIENSNESNILYMISKQITAGETDTDVANEIHRTVLKIKKSACAYACH